jgi:hypothetical protein
MPNDAILLAADQLKFNWPTFRRFRAYLIGVAADNKGTVQITEYPGKHQIIHRPLVGRSHVWDFGFDGYMLYNKTGGLPDIVAYSLLIVRDRGRARKAGEIITKLLDKHKDELTALKALAKGNSAAAITLAVLHPALRIIGSVLSGMDDKVLDTMQGAKAFSPADKAMTEIADTTSGTICTAQFEFDLFDAAEDDDTAADITTIGRELAEDRTMLTL